jgi:uncharacterized RDD family membrane protein YckC
VQSADTLTIETGNPDGIVQPLTNPYAPPRAAVLDVVDPYAQIVPADRGTRLGAALLDGVFLVLVYIPFLIAFVIGDRVRKSADDAGSAAIIIGGQLLLLVGLIVWASFTILYVKRNGQTIAKKMLGIKVVRSDGSQASLGRIFWLRNVVNGLIGIVPLYGLIDHLFIFGESRQCLHDKIADTMVIKA